MDTLAGLNRAMTYIEDNLEGDINYKEVAKIACCSEYHFKRMFSFLAGVTLSEYIRRRRLSLAALDLSKGKMRVIDVAVKYGYNSPDSFSRAFYSVHAVSPSEAKSMGFSLKAYPKITFQLSIQGGIEMNYRVIQKESFKIVGLKHRVNLVSEGINPDISEILEQLSEKESKQLEELSNIEPSGLIHVCTNFSENEIEGELDYYIAAATTKSRPATMEQLEISAYTWVIFEVEGDWEKVDDAWGRIYSEWFPSSGYEHAEGPEIMASKENWSEIWVPVVKK